MAILSNETRNKKYVSNENKMENFADWVKEYAEANDMSTDQVLNLALFRLEAEANGWDTALINI